VVHGKHRLPVFEAIQIGIDACLGLQALHAQGLIHKDLKPASIVIEGKKAFLIDLGLAEPRRVRPASPAAPPTIPSPKEKRRWSWNDVLGSSAVVWVMNGRGEWP